jgi:hypothetical protein
MQNLRQQISYSNPDLKSKETGNTVYIFQKIGDALLILYTKIHDILLTV